MTSHNATMRPVTGLTPPLSFDEIYGAWFEHVVRWLRAMGCPDSELEDLAQEVFIVVRRRLQAFDGRNLPGWLYKIANRQVRDLRRRSWFRNLVAGRGRTDPDDLKHERADALDLVEQKEKQRLLTNLLAGMSEKRRTIFVLFEIEGYSGEEIAAMLEVPVNTVWTRLHHARRDFLARVQVVQSSRGEGDA